MRKRRWSDNDRHIGPLTYSIGSAYKAYGVLIDSGDDEYPGCCMRAHLGRLTMILELPQVIQPWRHWVDTSRYQWSDAGGGYWDVHHRQYGFTVSDGFLQVFLGQQTHDSTTTKNWCAHLPWTQWRFVRKSLYNPDGSHFWTEPTRRQVPGGASWEKQERMRKAVPKVVFEFDDFDGERINATTHIEEWEWRFGEGWFKWLSLFRKPKVRRTLDIWFSQEVGQRKGSWKGGTIGHSVEFKPGEFPVHAFCRYCAENNLTFVRQA